MTPLRFRVGVDGEFTVDGFTIAPTPANACAADIDDDGDVDFADFLALAGGFGAVGCDACASSPCPADVDTDGDVDFGDFLALSGEFGESACRD